MRLKVLIVPDKFKGTLTAEAAAAAIQQGWLEARPNDTLETLAMSDGGDGFGEVLARLLPVQSRSVRTVDAAHRPCESLWWHSAQLQTALIESARIIGLAMLPPGRYHPFALDTFGLGAVLRAAIEARSQVCLVGIGGSATNDAGFGLACSLGWQFLTAAAEPITRWTDLTKLARIEKPARQAAGLELVVATDVQNPLLGTRGATRVYGPQKGLREADYTQAEACLGRLAAVWAEQCGSDAAEQPGDGAAGGLGFGLRCFLDARLESGFSLFARYARLEERIAAADLVITGEGEVDASTMMGKGVGQVAAACRRQGLPCLALAGTARSPELAAGPFTRVDGIAPGLASVDAAKARPAYWLARLARKAASGWDSRPHS